MSRFNLLFDPVAELVLEDSGANIDDPLLWRLGQFKRRLWQVLVDIGMVLVQEVSDLLHSQSFISIYREIVINIMRHARCRKMVNLNEEELTYCGI